MVKRAGDNGGLVTAKGPRDPYATLYHKGRGASLGQKTVKLGPATVKLEGPNVYGGVFAGGSGDPRNPKDASLAAGAYGGVNAGSATVKWGPVKVQANLGVNAVAVASANARSLQEGLKTGSVKSAGGGKVTACAGLEVRGTIEVGPFTKPIGYLCVGKGFKKSYGRDQALPAAVRDR